MKISNQLTCLVSLWLLFFCFACINTDKSAGYFISHLNNIREIKVFLYHDERVLHLTSERDIKYFLSTFKSTQSTHPESFSPAAFEANGHIVMVDNNNRELLVKVDLDQGYYVNIDNKDYFERFTYRTGRYLAEIN